MTNLTDAVARAIDGVAEIVDCWDHDEERVDPHKAARAAIAEFCRYLREPSEELIIGSVSDAILDRGYPDGPTCIECIKETLCALATHIEGEK